MGIRVQTLIQERKTRVWDAWTSADEIKNWNFASEDWHCPQVKNDFRVGGKFCFTMASKDGKISFDFSGIYDEIETEELIKYTLDDGRKVEIQFSSIGRQSKVVQFFEPEDQNSVSLQEAGWQAILDNFRRYIEG